MDRKTQAAIAAVFGTVFLTVILIVALAIPKPSEFQYQVFRITLALAAGGAGAMIPGILNVSLSKVLSAGGALAVFITVYFYSPAQLAVDVAESSYRAPESVYEDQIVDAKQVFERRRTQKVVGISTLSDVIDAHRRYVRAELDATTSADRKVEVWKHALDTARKIQADEEESYRAGVVTDGGVAEARGYRRDVELALAKATSGRNK